MPVTSLLDLQIQPDKVEEAIVVLRRVLAETRAFDGCLGVTVIQDSADPAHIVAVETWDSLGQDATYRAWRAGDGAIPDLPGLLVDRTLTVAVDRDDI